MQWSLLILIQLSPALGLITYECTDSTGSSKPIVLRSPNHRIELTSPNFPKSFNNTSITRLNCVWKIRALHGAQVNLKLTVAELYKENGCFDNELKAVDDSPKSSKSALKYPGVSAKCGQSKFPAANQVISGSGEVTVSFSSLKQDGPPMRWRLLVTASGPAYCPASRPAKKCSDPLCQGKDCCLIALGNKPAELVPSGYPARSAPGLTWSVTLLSAPGSQISLNFLELDINTSPKCTTDFLQVKEEGTVESSLIGPEGKKFCGQQLPNYPGPSVLVSSGNMMTITYVTDGSGAVKGRGFKILAAAINPMCNIMSFQTNYGEEVCQTSCGVRSTPIPTTPPIGITEPTMTTPPTTVTMPPTTTTLTTTTTPPELKNKTCEQLDTIKKGTEIKHYDHVLNWEACAHKCLITLGCEGWNYVTENYDDSNIVYTLLDGECLLLTTVTGNSTLEGIISGTAKCGKWVATTTPLSTTTATTTTSGIEEWTTPIRTTKRGETETSPWETSTPPTTEIYVGSTTTTPPPPCSKGVTMTILTIDANTRKPLERVHVIVTSKKRSRFEDLAALRSKLLTNSEGKATEKGILGAIYDFEAYKGVKKLGIYTMIKDLILKKENVTECTKLITIPMNFTEKEITSCDPCKGEVTVVNSDNPTIPLSGVCISYSVSWVSVQPPIFNPYISPDSSADSSFASTQASPNKFSILRIPKQVNASELRSLSLRQGFVPGFPFFIPAVYCPLLTDLNGKAAIDTSRPGKYIITAILKNFVTVTGEMEVIEGENYCKTCNFTIPLEMKRKFCNLTMTPVMLRVRVYNETSETPVQSAHVRVFISGSDKDVNTTTNDKGIAVVPVTENARYTVVVTASNYEPLSTTTDVICNLTACELCKPHLTVNLKTPPTPEVILICEGKIVERSLTVESFDMNNMMPIPGAQVTILHMDSVIVDKAGFMNGRYTTKIIANGLYNMTVSAPGFKDSHTSVAVNCDPKSCKDCRNGVTIYLPPDVCSSTDFTLTVRESGSKIPLQGAEVTISDISKPLDPLILGYNLKTDKDGMVVITSPGEALLKIDVAKEGFSGFNGSSEVYCRHPCDACNASLSVHVVPVVCDDITMVIKVTDEKENNIENAKVTILLVSSLAGPASAPIYSGISTDSDGTVTVAVLQAGDYQITTNAIGYQSNTQSVTVNNSTKCTKLQIPVKVNLPPTKPTPHCEGGIKLQVRENRTGLLLPGALVNVTQENTTIATDAETDSTGTVDLPVSMDGTLKITVKKDKFVPMTTNTSLEFPSHCNKTIEVRLVEKSCPLAEMPITVVNSLTKTPLENALVTLLLTGTPAGPSLTQAAPPKYTNEKGTVVFSVPMNGDYIVGVKVDGFDPVEKSVNQECDHDDCAACTNTVVLHSPPKFCPNKELRIVLVDCFNSSRLDNVSLTTMFVSENVNVNLGEFISSENGEVMLPLYGNGIYDSIVSLPGYITVKHSYQVDVDMTDCAMYTPESIIPMCPPPQKGCTDVSLTWTSTADLDLHNLRVSNKNVTEVCESKPSCCTEECKKTQCKGITTHVDFPGSLINITQYGTETITYCGVAGYSDMIYVEQTEGKGLPTSGAKLFITNGQEKREVEISASGPKQDSKFWLAGCLINMGYNFTFESVNEYSILSPKRLDPLRCHDISKIKAVAKAGSSLPDTASITVLVLDKDGQPVVGAITQVSNTWESSTRVVDSEGKAKLDVERSGPYIVKASSNGFLPDQANIEFSCDSNDICERFITFSLVSSNSSGELELLLNWGDKAINLDLHTLQVEITSQETNCETFYGKKKICENTVVKPSSSQGEVLTISDLKSSSRFSYMIFVKDNSPTRDELRTSEAHLTISDGRKTVSRILPIFTDATPEGAQYWFVGCLGIIGRSFSFTPVDTVARESPYKTQELFCHNLLKDQVPGIQRPSPPFCEDITLRLRLQYGEESLFLGSIVSNASIQVLSTEGGIIQEVAKASGNGEFSVKIVRGGRYMVQASGPDLITTRDEFNVWCDLTKCDECEPIHVLSISPKLVAAKSRVMLSWSGLPNKLRLYIFLSPSKKLLSSSDNSNSLLVDTDSKGMIFVENISGNPGFSTATKARISLFTSTGQVLTHDLTTSRGVERSETYWLAGCYYHENNRLKFASTSLFDNIEPNDLYEDFCDDYYGNSA